MRFLLRLVLAATVLQGLAVASARLLGHRGDMPGWWLVVSFFILGPACSWWARLAGSVPVPQDVPGATGTGSQT
jgi:hypothetical protein